MGSLPGLHCEEMVPVAPEGIGLAPSPLDLCHFGWKVGVQRAASPAAADAHVQARLTDAGSWLWQLGGSTCNLRAPQETGTPSGKSREPPTHPRGLLTMSREREGGSRGTRRGSQAACSTACPAWPREQAVGHGGRRARATQTLPVPRGGAVRAHGREARHGGRLTGKRKRLLTGHDVTSHLAWGFREAVCACGPPCVTVTDP